MPSINDESRPMMLTTVDNPYNPFTNYTEWYVWDVTMGYNTCALLGRTTITSTELSDEDQIAATHKAIETIVRLDLQGVFIAVFKDESTVIEEPSQ